MKPFFLQYKSITVSWFMAFALALIIISYFIVRAMAKKYGEDKEKIDDIFFILLISGFIGGRITYALANLDLYKENLFLTFKLSHYNLSLIGGLVIGLITLEILSKIYKMELKKLLRIFAVPFYFSMAIGIWVVTLDKFLLPFNISNNPIKILYLSIMFLLGMILELFLSKKIEYKYLTPIILTTIMILYYLV